MGRWKLTSQVLGQLKFEKYQLSLGLYKSSREIREVSGTCLRDREPRNRSQLTLLTVDTMFIINRKMPSDYLRTVSATIY